MGSKNKNPQSKKDSYDWDEIEEVSKQEQLEKYGEFIPDEDTNLNNTQKVSEQKQSEKDPYDWDEIEVVKVKKRYLSDEAINNIRHGVKFRIQPKRGQTVLTDGNKLKDLYESGMSISDISIKLGIGRGTIGRRIKSLGISRTNKESNALKLKDKNYRENHKKIMQSSEVRQKISDGVKRHNRNVSKG